MDKVRTEQLSARWSKARNLVGDKTPARRARPQVERRRRILINQRNGKTETREIDALDVMLARVASFNSDVVVLRSMKVSELRRSFFPTIGTNDSPKFPR